MILLIRSSYFLITVPDDTELLRALHSRNSKNIPNPLIFSSNNGFLLMFLAGPRFKNPPAGKPAPDFRPFCPGIII